MKRQNSLKEVLRAAIYPDGTGAQSKVDRCYYILAQLYRRAWELERVDANPHQIRKVYSTISHFEEVLEENKRQVHAARILATRPRWDIAGRVWLHWIVLHTAARVWKDVCPAKK